MIPGCSQIKKTAFKRYFEGMAIKRGTYRLEKRSLNFSLADDLDFKNSDNCFYFRGGNGFGKTSFLEKIIIPALKTDKIQYIYSGSIYANIGLQGAVSEIIPNLIQAGGGIAGGLLAFAAFKKIVKD